jgi:hypothetical protein
MIRNLEEQKAKVTKELTDALEKYYETFEVRSNQEGFDINKIEQMMLENQREIKKVLEEANSELVSSVEAAAKKNALNVEIN